MEFKIKKHRLAVITIVVITILATLLGGCGKKAEPAASGTNTTSETKEVKKYRMGAVAAPTSIQTKGAEYFAQKVKEKTNGAIEISIFPGGQLGGDEALGQELSRGNLDFALLNQGSLAGMDPLLDFHYLPYIVQNFKQADALYYGDGIIPTTMKETLAKYKIHALAFYELEFRGLSNSKRPVASVNDIKGLKLRVPGSKAIMGFFQQAGAQAVAIPMPELYTALQQKTVDGQDNGVIITYDNKLHEANKFYTRTNHVYAMGSIVISEELWGKLSPEDQKIVEEAAKEAQAWEVAEERKLTDDYISKMKEQGVTVVEPTPEQMQEFQAVGVKVWDSLKDVYGAERIEKLKEEVNKVKDLK